MMKTKTISHCYQRVVYERLEVVDPLGKSCILSSVVCSVRNGWTDHWLLASNVSFGVYSFLAALESVKNKQTYAKHIPQATDVR